MEEPCKENLFLKKQWQIMIDKIRCFYYFVDYKTIINKVATHENDFSNRLS